MVFNLAGSEKVMFELRPNGVRDPVMQRLWAGCPREEERQVPARLERNEHGKEDEMSPGSQEGDWQGLWAIVKTSEVMSRAMASCFEQGSNLTEFTFYQQ